jgi:hypothetical protein
MVNRKKTFHNVIIDYSWGRVNDNEQYGHIFGTFIRGVATFMA